MSKKNEIFNTILESGLEYDLFEMLSEYIVRNQIKMKNQNQNYRSTIKGIKKINQGKDQTIENLCDLELNNKYVINRVQ